MYLLPTQYNHGLINTYLQSTMAIVQKFSPSLHNNFKTKHQFTMYKHSNPSSNNLSFNTLTNKTMGK